MAKRKDDDKPTGDNVLDYRHKNVTRLNIPPAGLEARGSLSKEKKIRFAYNPHLAPTLRFDATGQTDRLAELIDAAGKRKLEPAELAILQDALRTHEPWLEWAGKREQQWCVADPVALHIHERVSTQAILRVAKREDIQRSLFADPEQEYHEAVQFYKHPMDWTNRMILGDSLSVIASLARREALAGKVQMIYMDPPYGIKYASNFQPEVGRRDVKDRDEDLTREPEMVKAYRDTWTLGVHSYLSYLRDRLLLCKELLADSGSIFVQIGGENEHRVRDLLDEVFGAENHVAAIAYRVFGIRESEFLDSVTDNILWYAKSKAATKRRQLFQPYSDTNDEAYSPVRLFRPGFSPGLAFDYGINGRNYRCPSHMHWATGEQGLSRLRGADRLITFAADVRYKRYNRDFPCSVITTSWNDTWGEQDKRYVVQTSSKVIERCMLMTTDPGDLVLDPTCGSGTTAYVAEEWGRRWITVDVSRVALAIARQRLLTAKYDYYKLRPTSAADVQRNPEGPWLADPACQIQGSCTFDVKNVPHITLKSIAQNQALDPIFTKWAPVLADKLESLNDALQKHVTGDVRFKLLGKLEAKQKQAGKKAITDADRRRWQLPEKSWQEWEIPFDTDPDWPKPLQQALTEYREAWRQKMDEVNACIQARADQEELVDQPFVEKGKVRVSGPFTMEGVIPAEDSIEDEPEESPIGGAPEALDTFGDTDAPVETEGQNTEAYLDRMIRLLREDGVRFPDNKVMKFVTLEMLADGSTMHATGTWKNGEGERQVAVVFGPQYGPLTAGMVEEGIRTAARRGFDDLVFAAFSFDGAAQAIVQEDPDPRLRIHMAQIRPDVNMGDLLKTTISSQLFTVSGSPRTRLENDKDGQYTVCMEGVDIYDPITNSVRSTGAEKVAAWFLDSDYDGRCFCICQAFFPDKSAWDKLGKALGSTLDDDAFTKLSGTTSLPFPAGPHQRIAIKVIDPRGNEVMRVHKLGGSYA
ncbi:MAG: hypothetical protein HYX84_04885 [Chloroflexi bacterium]|nr:hypothetical protein [Chloroflexota bacterium]